MFRSKFGAAKKELQEIFNCFNDDHHSLKCLGSKHIIIRKIVSFLVRYYDGPERDRFLIEKDNPNLQWNIQVLENYVTHSKSMSIYMGLKECQHVGHDYKYCVTIWDAGSFTTFRMSSDGGIEHSESSPKDTAGISKYV